MKDERSEILKKAGYFTVAGLLKKLMDLNDEGLGDKMIAGIDGHFQYCEYSEIDKEVLIC